MRTPSRRAARTTLAASLIGAAAFSGGVAFANSAIVPSSQDNPLVHQGCVIRFDTKDVSGRTVPRIHANEGHYCVGVVGEPTVDDAGNLEVVTDTKGQPVVSISVNSDETLTKKGISCGGSGGAGLTRITCVDREGNPVRADSPLLHHKYANLWLSWTTWEE